MKSELDTPPADPVEWLVRTKGPHRLAQQILRHGVHSVDWSEVTVADVSGYRVTVEARTAWLAHVAACPQLPGSPPFGSCVVERVGGGR